MALPRKQSIEQLKRLRSLTKGDIGDKTRSSKKMKNMINVDNPLDRKIDTYESFLLKKKENINPISESILPVWNNYIVENKDFVFNNRNNINFITNDFIKDNEYRSDLKHKKSEISNIIKNYLNENMGPGNIPFFNKNNLKQVLTSQSATNLFQIGKYVKLKTLEGYIDSIDNKYIYISSTKGDLSQEKISYKSFFKELSKEKITENSGLYSEFWSDINEDIDYSEELVDEEDEINNEIDDEFDDEIGNDEFENEIDDEIGNDEFEDEIDDEFENEIDNYSIYKDNNITYITTGLFDNDVEDRKIRRIGPSHIPGKPRRTNSPNNPNEKPKEYPNNIPRELPKRIYNGTEDNPSGIDENFLYENEYKNDFKSIKCNICGEMVENTYHSKISHIRNKHFIKPEMDGNVPEKTFTYDTTWPQGGKIDNELIEVYFGK
jgi:tellurite resistance-related uncharacterized protein